MTALRINRENARPIIPFLHYMVSADAWAYGKMADSNIIWATIGAIVASGVTILGNVYITRSKVTADTPFELLRQYKIMVDTLNADLKEVRGALAGALAETHALRGEVAKSQQEVQRVRDDLAKANIELETFRATQGI